MKQAFVKGTNIQIRSILEQLVGVAVISGFDEDGAPEYAGETEVCWDSQESVLRGEDRVFIGEDNLEYLESECEFREEDEEQA